MLRFAVILAVTIAAVVADGIHVAVADENHRKENSSSPFPLPNGVNGKMTPQLHAQMRGDMAKMTNEDLLRALDTNGDLKISLIEQSTYANNRWDAGETLEDAKSYDLDHDGFISPAEIDAYRTGVTGPPLAKN